MLFSTSQGRMAICCCCCCCCCCWQCCWQCCSYTLHTFTSASKEAPNRQYSSIVEGNCMHSISVMTKLSRWQKHRQNVTSSPIFSCLVYFRNWYMYHTYLWLEMLKCVSNHIGLARQQRKHPNGKCPKQAWRGSKGMALLRQSN